MPAGKPKLRLAISCYRPSAANFPREIVKSPRPHTYLQPSNLPLNFDWRLVNGTNYASHVLNQQSPNVCGSCWAEATTGALSDRFVIATQGLVRFNLSPQVYLNFNSTISGGDCNGGDHLAAMAFAHQYGVADLSCAPFLGLQYQHGFEVSGLTDVEHVRAHQCWQCDWDGTCAFPRVSNVNLYGADEYGTVLGEFQMQAEIFARGPISCLLNSEPAPFDQYLGGIVECPQSEPACQGPVDHVVVIAGWGVDALTRQPYWVGRNSYGTVWGEGGAGGWFRLARGSNALNLERSPCVWGVPAAADVQRALAQFYKSVGSPGLRV